MTYQDYLNVNEQGFEGDSFLKKSFEKLIKEFNIENIVETGTFRGNTTIHFAEMAKNVFTSETNPESYKEAIRKFTNKNIKSYLESSTTALIKIFPELKGNTLFFLDAHWGDNNPLLEELKLIKEANLKPVIIIHDFKVPNHPELGYDTYNGQDYNWEWIKESIENIYGKDNYDHFYNTEAEGMMRGVIFITSK